jgi:hypothetical protein
VSRRALIVTAACLLGTLLLPVEAHATFPGTNGHIAVTSIRPPEVVNYSQYSVFTMEPDGSDVQGLVASAWFDDGSPSWSADGTKIVFTRASGEIRVMRFDGVGDHRVGSGYEPSWSADGAKILFRDFNGQSIWVMNADGSGVTRLNAAVTNLRNFSPRWSPDGSKIAFVRCDQTNRCDIHTMNPNGSGVVNLTVADSSTIHNRPDWSPDGAKLLFLGQGGVTTMNADGTGITAIGRFTNDNAVWSPDGSKIVYSTSAGFGSGDIHITAADGTNDSVIIDTPNPSGLSWQACQGACPTFTMPYDVPATASNAYFKFVPNFRQTISDAQCQSRGGTPSTHGPPLSVASCNPPAYLPGTRAHQGPNGESGVHYFRGTGDPRYGADEVLHIEGGATDIENAAGGPYGVSGQDVLFTIRARVSDLYSGPSLTEPATITDFELAIRSDCAPDTESGFGAFCGAVTTSEALMPGSFRPNRRAVIQLFEVQMKDVGADGVLGNADDRGFLFSGIAVP